MPLGEEQALLSPKKPNGANLWYRLTSRKMFTRIFVLFSLLFSFIASAWIVHLFLTTPDTDDFYLLLKDYCVNVSQIKPDEYSLRHRRLYHVLKEEKAEALVMEGGAGMLYYLNIDWSLTERPFMVILKVDDSLPTGINTTIITPAFEATRAAEKLKKAHLPDDIQPTLVEWLEYKSPFESISTILNGHQSVLIEQNARLFIYDGISNEVKNVMIAPKSIRMLRMIKSSAELDIMRCANTVTELAIRTVKPHIKVGMREVDIEQMMEEALEIAGLQNVWVLALVDENAALPHGNAGQKEVKKHSTVLIDTGGELLGYQSDTTRTFFMGKRGYNQTIEDAWYLVRRAQENVLNHSGTGSSCAEVDRTARDIIEHGGYGPYFTHRLGHGIGKEMHEEPYMNEGNTDQWLVPGMTFSVEPGIYVPDEFGIRLEDIVVVSEEGRLELLTSGLAQNPWTL